MGTSIPQNFSMVKGDEGSGGSNKKGFRSVGFDTVMSPFELSHGLSARRSYLLSLRCPRFPSGRWRAQCPSLRHLAHLVRSFSCSILERFIRGPCSLPPSPRLGPKKPLDSRATLRSSRAAQYPGCRKAGRTCTNICCTSFSSTVVSWPSSEMQKTPRMAIPPTRAIVVSPSSQNSTSS